ERIGSSDELALLPREIGLHRNPGLQLRRPDDLRLAALDLRYRGHDAELLSGFADAISAERRLGLQRDERSAQLLGVERTGAAHGLAEHARRAITFRRGDPGRRGPARRVSLDELGVARPLQAGVIADLGERELRILTHRGDERRDGSSARKEDLRRVARLA